MDSLKSFFVIMFTGLFSLSHASLVQGSPERKETDRDTLLEFRSSISDDPGQIFSSWNDTIDFCHWPGITCGRRHLRVTELKLPGSRISGSLSPYIGNLSFLRIINIENNSFTGEIPHEIGKLHRLTELRLDNNSFSGQIPENISGCLNLRVIRLWNSELVGEIPAGLANLLELRTFQISKNKFMGNFPDFFGNFSSLEFISAVENNFEGSIPASLGRLQKLRVLSLGGNFLYGTIPTSIFNITSLTAIDLANNQLEGGLPPDLGVTLPNLFFVGFGCNHFIGPIPPSIVNATNLQSLQIPNNSFSGSVPDLSNLNRLRWLSVSLNQLGSGESGDLAFVESLNSTKLQVLQKQIGRKHPLKPWEMPKLELVGSLSKQPEWQHTLKNKLSGRVPSNLGQCTSLVELSMGNNLFEGNISPFLRPLKGLQYLDLSWNNFSGEIPKFLKNLQLTYLNLSFNRFVGEVPNQGVFLNATGISVIGNEKLCGGISQLNLPNCPTPKSKHGGKISSKEIIGTATGVVMLFVVLLLHATYIGMKTNRKRIVWAHSGFAPVIPFPKITYEDMLRATEGFNKNKLIGAGGFGSVYKGILRNCDNMVAIKVLDLRTRAASKSFMIECEALRNIRHRNLVKIFTACSTVDFQGNDFKALVYEYMENGSLEEWLHPKRASEGVYQKLSLIHRMSVAIDIACALEYLHHECETPVIHCDLKPSNILLDAEMNAHVSDFGLARILSAADVVLQLSSVGVRGTVGYSPPEYGMGSEVSREGDVYSYGILLLEMFTGKRPIANMFEGAWNIRCYCEAALPERAAEIADPCLFSNEFGEGSSIRAPKRVKECLAKVLEIGIGCCRESPGERMDIREATVKLRSIKPLAS